MSWTGVLISKQCLEHAGQVTELFLDHSDGLSVLAVALENRFAGVRDHVVAWKWCFTFSGGLVSLAYVLDEPYFT